MADRQGAGEAPGPESPGGGSPPVREFFPYLCIRGAAEAIDFYRRTFGATERFRMTADDGRVAHAELEFGSAVLMVSDEYPDLGIHGPAHWGGTPVRFHLHVDDVDGLVQRATDEGAVVLRGPRDEEHGERQCLLRDSWGHEWLLGGPVR